MLDVHLRLNQRPVGVSTSDTFNALRFFRMRTVHHTVPSGVAPT
jgi:hypothetical protein